MASEKLTPESVEAYGDFAPRDPKDWALREKEVAAMNLDDLFEPKSLGGPGSGHFGHSGRPGQLGGSASGKEPAGGFAQFRESALGNLGATSRTVKGISDTTSSEDKPKLVTEGDDLIKKTTENFDAALSKAWSAREREFESPEAVLAFTEDISATVSDGLLQPGQSLYRTWETKNDQLPPSQIESAMKDFTASLYDRMKSNENPKKTAAWIEKELSVIHPWADGVGRTTKVLSAFALARGGVAIPKYPDRKKYYQEITQSAESWTAFYESLF